MDLIYDSLLILAPLWLIWLYKNYNRKSGIFFLSNAVFFIFSPAILWLSLYIFEQVIAYTVFIYIWVLISFFSVSLLLKNKVILTSLIVSTTLISILIYSIPHKEGQFYHWSYWRNNAYTLDINAFDKYETKTHFIGQKIYKLVECKLKKNNSIDKWKFNVHYQSDRDTILDFKYLKSYSKESYMLDFYQFTTYRIPSETSQFKGLFDKEKRTLVLISVAGKPKKFMEDKEGIRGILQELMVNFNFYNDYLTFRWENKKFWFDLANSNADYFEPFNENSKYY